MTVSVVILNWNTRFLLEEYLPVVIANSNLPGVEVIVADNGSTDGSVTWLRETYPLIKVLELGQNFGFAGGYNKAISMVSSQLTVLLNSDVAPGVGWLTPLVAVMDKNPGVVACVPKIKDRINTTYFEHAGAAGGFIDKLGYPFCRGRIFKVVEEDAGQYNDAIPVFWGSGAALLVRTVEFNDSGGFDADFFAHMEEIDWCWRMKNQGRAILCVPSSQVFHLGGGTLGYQNPRKTFLNFRNNLYMILKNVPGWTVYPLLIVRMLLDMVAIVLFLTGREWKNASAVIKAHFNFIAGVRLFLSKRRLLMKMLNVGSHAEMYNGSIVFDFFLRKRRYFHQIPFMKANS